MNTIHPSVRLGWLGIGRMGAAMAGRLLDGGEPLTIWNRTKSKTDELAERGAAVAQEITDLASSSDIVFIMVSTPADLIEVVAGPRGLLSAPEKPSIIVDCSTVSAATSAEVRAKAETAGTQFLAAPISGNPHVVAEGDACIVASGPGETYKAVETYLTSIAKVAVHAGEEEQSRLVKLAHNLYLGMMVQALVEVTSLVERGGTTREAFLEFLNGTVLGSDWVRQRTPDLVARDWTPTFTTELLRKDFDLGLAAAQSLEVPMPVGALTHQVIQTAIGVGHRSDDFLSLYDVQVRAAGMDLGVES